MQYSHYSIPFYKNIRIMQISDVHFSPLISRKQNRRTAEKIAGAASMLAPGIIAVTGDLVSRNAGISQMEDAAFLVSLLQRHSQVFLALGNHETDMPKSLRLRFLTMLEEEGAVILANRTVFFKGIPIAGLAMPPRFYRNRSGSFRDVPICTAGEISRRLGKALPQTILLAHNPLWLSAYADWGASLVLSGHVHGGIVRLPVVGGVLSPERSFFPRYTKGIYVEENTRMVVSAGIGKLRIGNPSEIVLLSLGTQL